MWIEKLPNGREAIHTTTTEFAELYKTHTAKQMSEIYGIPVPTINKYVAVLRLRKNRWMQKKESL